MRNWAQPAIEELRAGRNATIRPRGNSMRPKVMSGDVVELTPIDEDTALKKGDIVLVKVGTRVYLHLIKAIDGNRFLIGNNRGGTNGWVGRQCLYGKFYQIK